MSKQPEYRHEPERPTGFTLHLEFHHRESGEPLQTTRGLLVDIDPRHMVDRRTVSLPSLFSGLSMTTYFSTLLASSLTSPCWVNAGQSRGGTPQTHNRPTTDPPQVTAIRRPGSGTGSTEASSTGHAPPYQRRHHHRPVSSLGMSTVNR